MHELSLAESMIQIVEREMKRYPDRQLTAIEIEVGALAGVEMQAFTTALDAVVRSSAYPSAKVEITSIPAHAECLACGHQFATTRYIPECPQCGSGACGVTSGMELRISALRLE
ncbi:MAG: hydrogenase maturation nickel metallochaperone HypA [Bacteroidales bacterium]|nr:hydrogenase maturation nickel metallochaperone HypA [Bacteroidales bacterium]